MATTPRVNVRNQIGFGGAQVYDSTAMDLSQTGAAVTRDSDRYKNKQKVAGGQEELKKLDPDYDGFLPAQVREAEKFRNEIVQYARNPENIKKDTYQQDLSDMAHQYQVFLAESATAAKFYSQKNQKFSAYDPYELDNLDEFSSLTDPNALEGVDRNNMNAEILTTVQSLSRRIEGDWREKTGSYDLQKYANTQESGDKEVTTTQYGLPPAVVESEEKKFEVAFMAGRNTVTGNTARKSRDGEALYAEAYDQVMNGEEHEEAVSALGNDPLEIDNYIKEVAKKNWMDEVKAKSGVRTDTSTKPADKDSGMSAEDYQNKVLEIKKRVNDFQVSGDPTALNKYLASGQMRVIENKPGEYVVQKIKTTGSGDSRQSNWEQISPSISMEDAETLYDVIGKEQDIPDKYFGQTEYENTEVFTDQFLQEKSDFESKMESQDALNVNKIGKSKAQKFYDKNLGSGEVEVVSADKIKVKGKDGKFKEYDISDDGNPSEAYQAIINAWGRDKQKTRRKNDAENKGSNNQSSTPEVGDINDLPD